MWRTGVLLSEAGWSGWILWAATAVALLVVTFVASLAVIAVILVKMPADAFAARPARQRLPTTLGGWARRIAKNLLGAGVIGLGLMLSLPGIPGQGLLTILIGLMLVDFPGKRRLERAILRRPRILGAVNRLRARYGRPSFELAPTRRTRRRPGRLARPATDELEGAG